jgi:hypothetical protein
MKGARRAWLLQARCIRSPPPLCRLSFRLAAPRASHERASSHPPFQSVCLRRACSICGDAPDWRPPPSHACSRWRRPKDWVPVPEQQPPASLLRKPEPCASLARVTSCLHRSCQITPCGARLHIPMPPALLAPAPLPAPRAFFCAASRHAAGSAPAPCCSIRAAASPAAPTPASLAVSRATRPWPRPLARHGPHRRTSSCTAPVRTHSAPSLQRRLSRPALVRPRAAPPCSLCSGLRASAHPTPARASTTRLAHVRRLPPAHRCLEPSMRPHAPACIARGRALARLPPLGSASATRLWPATGRATASARATAPGQVEERERGENGMGLRRKPGRSMPPVGKRMKAPERREHRRRRIRTSQGLVRNFRKLQGPFCKA